jgi:sRNA-binding carbon storage regulator CsrA
MMAMEWILFLTSMEKGILLMLLLTRRPNELIHIYPDDLPPDMTVAELFADGQIVGIKGNQVRLGTDATKKLIVLRDDVKEQASSKN